MATTPMQNPTVCVPAQLQSHRVLEQGDVLITEISAHYHGYPGQILRPFAIGTPPTPQYQRMYNVAAEAFNRIAAVIRDGAPIDAVLMQANTSTRLVSPSAMTCFTVSEEAICPLSYAQGAQVPDPHSHSHFTRT